MARALLLAVMALTLGGSATAEEELPSKHRYDTGDDVVLFASKIGPFENPTETYPYYDLPFCQPSEGTRGKAASLGEALGSDRLVSTPYVIKYGVNVRHAILCKKSLDAAAVKGFRDAVMQGYYWQMYMDELPLWGFVGEVAKGANAGAGASASSERYFLFTYLSFDVFHDGQGHIVKVTVSSGPIRGGGYAAGTEDSSEYSEYSGAGTEYGGEGNGTAPLVPVDITVAGDIKDVEFKYSVRWVRSDFDSYDSRMDRYLAVALLPHHLERHRLAVTYSGVTALLFAGLLTMLVMQGHKTAAHKKDMCDSITETGLEAAQQRLLQYDGSVLPAVPPYHNLLAAMLGVGIQILALAMCMFVLGLGGVFYPFNRGRQLVALVAFYALTAGIAGYVGGLHYRRLGGTNWAPNARLCSAVLGAPFLAVFTCLNTIAATYRSTAAVPFNALSSLGLGWALVAFPLTMLGGFAARNARVEPLAGAGVGSSRAAKPSSDGSYRLWPCHHTTLLRAAMAGALLFWAVHIELWYLLASVWGLNLYALYTPLLAVFVLLVLNTALVTAACTLLDLQRLGVEDPGWWWNSFLCGGSTGIYVCGYCCYFFARSSMRGLLQTAFFLGYSAVACWALFLVLGAVGAHASLLVVRRTAALR